MVLTKENAITFESDDVINNALEIRKLLDDGVITLDDSGIAGKQQARLQNTFRSLSAEDYLELFNSSKFNGVNGLNQALIERLPSPKQLANTLRFNAYDGKDINIYDHVERGFLGSIKDWGLKNFNTEELQAWIAWYEGLTDLQKVNVYRNNPRVGQGYDAIKDELARRQVEDLTDSSNVR